MCVYKGSKGFSKIGIICFASAVLGDVRMFGEEMSSVSENMNYAKDMGQIHIRYFVPIDFPRTLLFARCG